MNASKYLAELVGTFVLVFVGTMSILAAHAMNAPVLVVVPLGFGLALLAAIFAFGDVSGGHFNPAVTLGALLDGRIALIDALSYVVAQVVGALGASAVVLLMSSQSAVVGTTNAPGTGVSDVQAFGLEIILTALLVIVMLTVTERDRGHAPLAIPLTLIAIHLVGIPFSGASVNPARSLAPALVGGDLSHIWIYLSAPFVGAVVGWALFRAFDRLES